MWGKVAIPHLFRSLVFEVRMLSVDESRFGIDVRQQMVLCQLLVLLNFFIDEVTDVLLKFGHIVQLMKIIMNQHESIDNLWLEVGVWPKYNTASRVAVPNISFYSYTSSCGPTSPILYSII